MKNNYYYRWVCVTNGVSDCRMEKLTMDKPQIYVFVSNLLYCILSELMYLALAFIIESSYNLFVLSNLYSLWVDGALIFYWRWWVDSFWAFYDICTFDLKWLLRGFFCYSFSFWAWIQVGTVRMLRQDHLLLVLVLFLHSTLPLVKLPRLPLKKLWKMSTLILAFFLARNLI